ncbi:replication initiation protein RepC [Salipiger sp. P9]|uniref:plasmid replication protein RepC n=1 Tax=Salipiger pentaromativorans TaxID=2943193 RepID=UPI0021574636|nr:plasmid replication protein RepC [Salipiger pentaromativorans]MCR8550565.1 replication initiation protein RepC [Salipiger pentaromativorans]
MQRVTTTPFGRRPVSACQMATCARMDRPAPVTSIDKWEVLSWLSAARESFGLSDRTLRVLSVLLSFHGPRELNETDGLIVYASNARLSERAHGMPESTLRRHLATLVEAGLLIRHDSPNGKRYLRRDTDGGALRAFGFDLRPLLHRCGEFAAEARAADQRRNEIALLREEFVLLMRDAAKLTDLADDDNTLQDFLTLGKRLLRRKLTLDELTRMRDTLKPMVEALVEKLTPETPEIDPVTPEMSALGNQNERHIQDSDKSLIDLKAPQRKSLSPILRACPDVLPYAEKGLHSWEEFVQLMARMAPMTGIDRATWQEACRSMGSVDAATTLAGIIQRIGSIRSPGAYLRSLSKKARDGGFDPDDMIAALSRRAA